MCSSKQSRSSIAQGLSIDAKSDPALLKRLYDSDGESQNARHFPSDVNASLTIFFDYKCVVVMPQDGFRKQPTT